MTEALALPFFRTAALAALVLAGIHAYLGFHVVRRGVLLCGTGLGMSYAANRHHGVRAAVAWSPEVAQLSREHNDANVLVLPARCISADEGVEILRRWLSTPFAGGRHSRRVAKIEEGEGT